MIKILIFPRWKEWKVKRSLISLADAANGRNILPYGFSFFFFRVSRRKKKCIFSLVITRVNIYQYLLTKLQKRCYATAPVENSLQLFQKPFSYVQLVLQLFSASIITHFHIYLFQPNLPSLFSCYSISVMTDGQAEKGRSKFIIRKEWDYMIISHFS